MKIRGINIKAMGGIPKEIGEPSLNNWIKSFRTDGLRFLTDQTLANNITNCITDAYFKANNYKTTPFNYSVNKQNEMILPAGTLIHLSPITYGNVEIDYEKLLSIKEKGLLSIASFNVGDLQGLDNEVPYMVSFHRCAETRSVSEEYDSIMTRHSFYNHTNITSINELGIVIDSTSPGIQKLLAFDISNVRPHILMGPGYIDPITNRQYAYRLDKYPNGINTEAQKQALGSLRCKSSPMREGDEYAYLPIAVPSQYISAFILSSKQEQNKEFILFLMKEFPNATICNAGGKILYRAIKEDTRRD